MLKEICYDLLSKCRSSEEDEKALRGIQANPGDELEDRRGLALRWSIMQKNIMRRCIHLIERMG